ncbi:apolipoprotein N-acyltransferase [Limibacter armeniacum]|uniref:apolipoprotein N-acyltransferase n=1 Tax=Limibacter armeniacum TaxID=466084 RepID=UPI002FE6557E
MNSILDKYGNKRGFLPLMAILGGITIGLAWQPPFTFLAFVGLVPLLLIEEQIYRHDYKRPFLKLFGNAYLYLVTWNITTYWWLWYASGATTLAAWGANALLQIIPVMLFHVSKRASFNKLGYLPFVLYWISFEYLHLHWDFSWPWLNLGNVFGFTPSWVQWYEYTGTFGGTLWILLANIALFFFLTQKRMLTGFAIAVLLPLLVSFGIYYTYEDKGTPIETVVVQPNIDCYKEKYHYNSRTGERNQPTHIPYRDQVERLIQLSDSKVTPQTKFVFWPETSLHENFVEDNAPHNWAVQQAIGFTERHPGVNLVSGVDTYLLYGKKPMTETARYTKNAGYYDVFNAALFINDKQELDFYHKSQLVIGVETIPYPAVFKSLLQDFGGTFGGLGRQKEREAFINSDSVGTAPIICYESVYGEFVTGYVKDGANFLAVITNDGWWNTSPGHKQHLAFSSLRAIETRRSVARAANTGISCFINQRGDIQQPLAYGEMGAVNGTVMQNNEITIYTSTGDIIAKIAVFVAIFLFISILVKRKVTVTPFKKKSVVS